MSASAADPASHYDRVTAAWNIILGDDHHHGLFDGEEPDLASATERLTEVMAAAAEPQAGVRIVDLGCGTGTQACWLARHYPNASVVGITSSEVGVTLARERSAAAGLSDAVSFQRADALHSGLADGSFDIAWLIESSQYLGPRRQVMRECARLLVSGGRVALCDVVLKRPLTLRDLRRWHTELDILREVFGDAVMATPEEYRQAATEARFVITSELDLTECILPTFGCWRERARNARERVIGLIGEEGLTTFIAGCDVMERFVREGIVGYTLIAARTSS